VKDNDAFFGRLGEWEWWPSELRRALTSSGDEKREEESLRALLPMRLDVRRTMVGISCTKGNSSVAFVVTDRLRVLLPVMS
jgi:hypothetical protein